MSAEKLASLAPLTPTHSYPHPHTHAHTQTCFVRVMFFLESEIKAQKVPTILKTVSHLPCLPMCVAFSFLHFDFHIDMSHFPLAVIIHLFPPPHQCPNISPLYDILQQHHYCLHPNSGSILKGTTHVVVYKLKLHEPRGK